MLDGLTKGWRDMGVEDFTILEIQVCNLCKRFKVLFWYF